MKMNKFKFSVFCFLFLLTLTTTILAGTTRQIKAVFVQETGSSTQSELATATAMVSGTNLNIFLSETDKWFSKGKTATPSAIVIRYFDKEGNCLGSFITDDTFMPQWVVDLRDVEMESDGEFDFKQVIIFQRDTKIAHQITPSDISLIDSIELSFDPAPFNLPEKYGLTQTKEEYFELFESPFACLSIANYKLIDRIDFSEYNSIGVITAWVEDTKEIKKFVKFVRDVFSNKLFDDITDDEDVFTINSDAERREIKITLNTGKSHVYIIGTYNSKHREDLNEREVIRFSTGNLDYVAVSPYYCLYYDDEMAKNALSPR